MTTEDQIPQSATPPDTRLSPKDFSARIKAKYPQYKDVDDSVLAQKIIEKYPVYKDSVNLDQPKVDQPTQSDSPIDLALQADQLSKKTTALPSANLGTGSGAVSNKPDPEAQAQAKQLKEQVKAQGFDPDKITELFSPFPKNAFDLTQQGTNEKVLSKENLLQKLKDNPEEGERYIRDASNQMNLLNSVYDQDIKNGVDPAIAKNHAASIATDYDHSIKQYKDLDEMEQSVQHRQAQAEQYMSGETKETYLNNLEKTTSKFINAASPQVQEAWQKSNYKTSLDANQFAGLQSLKLYHPEQYNAAVQLLNATVQQDNKAEADPLSTFNPLNRFTTSETNKEADQTVDQKRGVEVVKKNLEQVGSSNTLNFVDEQLASINRQYESLKKEVASQGDPARANQLHTINELADKGESLQQWRDATTGYLKNSDSRYPYLKAMNEQNEAMNVPQYFAYSFGKGLENTGKGFGNLLEGVSGTDNEKATYGLQNLGESAKDQQVASKNQGTWHSVAAATGSFIPIAVQQYGLSASGAGKLISAFAPMYFASVNDYFKQGLDQGMPVSQADNYGKAHALIAAAIGMGIPYQKIAEGALGKVGEGITEDLYNTIKNSGDTWSQRFGNALGTTIKEATKNAALYGAGTSLGSDLLDRLAFGKKISVPEMIHNGARAFLHTAMDFIVPTGLHFVTHFASIPLEQKQAVYAIGIRPEVSKEEIENDVASGKITRLVADKRIEAVNKMAEIVKKVPDINANNEPLTTEQRAKFAYNLLLKSKLSEAKSIVGEATKETIKTETDKIDNKNEAILNKKGQAEENQPVTTPSAEIKSKFDTHTDEQTKSIMEKVIPDGLTKEKVNIPGMDEPIEASKAVAQLRKQKIIFDKIIKECL